MTSDIPEVGEDWFKAARLVQEKPAIVSLTREQFVNTPRSERWDKFALTFKAKADTLKLWPLMKGYLDEMGRVRAAIIIRTSARVPYVANLQLLHTFAGQRHRGLARDLVISEYARVAKVTSYFRVSSEVSAVGFYRALGLKFWGEQKSGSLLCMHRIASTDLTEGEYNFLDPVIQKALLSTRRGGLVERYAEPW